MNSKYYDKYLSGTEKLIVSCKVTNCHGKLWAEVKFMLEIKNVSKRYKGGAFANKNITLEIQDGEIFGFIGPNGAGKSTLIKSIVGLHLFDEGEISLDGLTLKKDDVEKKKKIAYIPDNPDLYENLTGISYLNFIADIFNISKDERTQKIDSLASKFEIKNDLGNKIKTYSHGMKQKLSLVAAFMHNPKLLILDEPFVGLDPKASYIVKELMKDYVSKGNIIFFSSHVLEVVEKLCSHVAIIKKGEIVFNSKIQDITNNESLESFFLELTEHA